MGVFQNYRVRCDCCEHEYGPEFSSEREAERIVTSHGWVKRRVVQYATDWFCPRCVRASNDIRGCPELDQVRSLYALSEDEVNVLLGDDEPTKLKLIASNSRLPHAIEDIEQIRRRRFA